jgi:kynurenine formamidase
MNLRYVDISRQLNPGLLVCTLICLPLRLADAEAVPARAILLVGDSR